MDWLRQLAISGVEAGWLSDSFMYAFMVNALVAALLLGPLLGGLGTLVIAKRLAFFSEAVGHAALTGIAIGVLLGEPPENPIIGLFSFCMIFALLLHFVRNRTNVPYDTLVGVFLALALAVGAALLMYVARKINIHMLENVLFGSILTVTDQDLAILAGSCADHHFAFNTDVQPYSPDLYQPRYSQGAWLQHQLLRLLVCHDDHLSDNCSRKDRGRGFSRCVIAYSRCDSSIAD